MARYIECRCHHCGRWVICDTYSIDEDNFNFEAFCPSCGSAIYICCRTKGGDNDGEHSDSVRM